MKIYQLFLKKKKKHQTLPIYVAAIEEFYELLTNSMMICLIQLKSTSRNLTSLRSSIHFNYFFSYN